MTIDIATTLRKLNDTYDAKTNEVKEYALRVLVADGQVRTLLCRKNVRSPKRGLKGELQARGKIKYNINYNGLIMLWDEEVQAPRNIKAACIFQFQDFKSKQWLDVVHC